MKIEQYGYNDKLKAYRSEQKLENYEIGRITAEHKERYTVLTNQGEFDAEITGNMRFAAQSREDFPAVGDWVAVLIYDGGLAIIHKILPRFSVIKRQAVGQFGEVQIIATNIDYALLIQATDRDFNINRLERYLTLCYASKVQPIIILTKIDIADEQKINEIIESINHRIADVQIIAISSETKAGYEALRDLIEPTKTYCLLGSSGVGKSTMLNNLVGESVMKTCEISSSVNKGRHTTSHRELILLDNGGLIIDNPGMREVGITDSDSGLESTYDYIFELAKNCKYSDCSHTNEIGCAVLATIECGELDRNSYTNYLKLEKEKAYFESSAEERRKKEKDFGKMVKGIKKSLKANKR